MVERVADILSADHPDAHRDELRSLAFGWPARPAELMQLLLEHAGDTPADPEQPTDSDARPCRALAFPADLLDALGRMNPEKLRPPATLYVHLHEAAVGGKAGGVARVEEIGPVLLAQLVDLLGHSHITVKPVVDLNDRVSVNAYDHPEGLREPYDPNGPPGQTGVHNSGPLGSRHHRWKTHAGYTSRQVGANRYVWRTPLGQFRLVDHRGTHHLDGDQGELMLDAPTGEDLCFADIELDLE